MICIKKECEYVKYFPEDLKREYDFYTSHNPDIEELKHPLINLSDVFRAYFILIHFFTDASSDEESEKMLIGIRSTELLASALSRQIVSFAGKKKYTEPLDICATLFFGMVKNHPFSDGNKRTALLILLYQLQLFGYFPRSHKKDFERLVLSVAENSLDEKYANYYSKFKKKEDWKILVISKELKRLVSKKDNCYHTNPTIKEFCAALERQGVSCTLDNSKVKLSRTPASNGWKFVRPKEYNYSIPFRGWTRTVGAGTARDVLNKLGLYDQIPSYRYFFICAEPMYNLVEDFKEPLRRLKDE